MYIYIYIYRNKTTTVILTFFLFIELSQNNSARDAFDAIIELANEEVINEQSGSASLGHHHGALYSDFTEKLQSLYSECKLWA